MAKLITLFGGETPEIQYFDSKEKALKELDRFVKDSIKKGHRVEKQVSRPDAYEITTILGDIYIYVEDDKVFNQGNNDDLLHITVHIGKFTLYRRMSCEALHKYVHSIIAKGYKLYRRLDGNGIGRIDESKICEAFFANGIALRKEDKMIVLEQTPKSKWK